MRALERVVLARAQDAISAAMSSGDEPVDARIEVNALWVQNLVLANKRLQEENASLREAVDSSWWCP